MNMIYKYIIDADQKVQTIKMPIGAKVLTAQMQGQSVCIWAKVETNNADDERIFGAYGTGHKMPEGFDFDYIGTFQPDEGGSTLVFHLFEIVK